MPRLPYGMCFRMRVADVVGDSEVDEWLVNNSLGKFAPKFESLGISKAEKLSGVSDATLDEMGMTTEEKRRFFASIPHPLQEAISQVAANLQDPKLQPLDVLGPAELQEARGSEEEAPSVHVSPRADGGQSPGSDAQSMRVAPSRDVDAPEGGGVDAYYTTTAEGGSKKVSMAWDGEWIVSPATKKRRSKKGKQQDRALPEVEKRSRQIPAAVSAAAAASISPRDATAGAGAGAAAAAAAAAAKGKGPAPAGGGWAAAAPGAMAAPGTAPPLHGAPTEEGIPGLVGMLAAEAGESQARAAEALLQLTLADSGGGLSPKLRAIIDAGGGAALAASLTGSDARARNAAAALVLQVALDDPTALVAMHAGHGVAGGLGRVAAGGSAQGREHAAAALWKLAASNPSGRGLIAADPSIARALSALAGGAPGEGGGGEASPAARRNAAGALGNLAGHAGARGPLAECGAVVALVSLLRQAPDPECARCAASALANLSVGHAGNQEAIAAAGAIPALVTLLRTGAAGAAVRGKCAEALQALAAYNPGNKAAIVGEGGITALVSALGAGGDGGGAAGLELRASGALALAHLLDGSGIVKEAVASAGGAEGLVALLAPSAGPAPSPAESRGVLYASIALRALASGCSKRTRHALTSAGAPKALSLVAAGPAPAARFARDAIASMDRMAALRLWLLQPRGGGGVIGKLRRRRAT